MGRGVAEALVEKWPVLARHDRAMEWLQIWTDLGRAPRTMDAYSRGLAEYLQVCEREGIDPLAAPRAAVALLWRGVAKLRWTRGGAEGRRWLWGSAEEPIRNRVMLALAYDAALRREELCALRSDDLDPADRTLRVRGGTNKTRRERVVPYSAPTGVLLSEYLAHRATLSRARGGLFLSESHRNHAEPITLWTWSKVMRRIALAANLPRC